MTKLPLKYNLQPMSKLDTWSKQQVQDLLNTAAEQLDNARAGRKLDPHCCSLAKDLRYLAECTLDDNEETDLMMYCKQLEEYIDILKEKVKQAYGLDKNEASETIQ